MKLFFKKRHNGNCTIQITAIAFSEESKEFFFSFNSFTLLFERLLYVRPHAKGEKMNRLWPLLQGAHRLAGETGI